MHFTAWDGEQWSEPFQPNELTGDGTGGLVSPTGIPVARDEDNYRGENWISLDEWTEEKAAKIVNQCSGYWPRWPGDSKGADLSVWGPGRDVVSGDGTNRLDDIMKKCLKEHGYI